MLIRPMHSLLMFAFNSAKRWLVALAIGLLFFSSCSPTRFLDNDETMLSRVSLMSLDKRVKPDDYRGYIRQEANARWFNLVKVPLGIYSLSRADTAKRGGRLWKRLGEAPVVYDSALTNQSATALRAALRTHGYLQAEVTTRETTLKRRTRVLYQMNPGPRWTIDSIVCESEDTAMLRLLQTLIASGTLKKGSPLDVAELSSERDRIVSTLQNRGYYALNKDYILFTADTLLGEKSALLHVAMNRPVGETSMQAYRTHTIRRVDIYERSLKVDDLDTITFNDLTLHYQRRPWLRRQVYNNHVPLRHAKLFSERDVQDTYAGLGGLQAVAYTMVHVSPASQEQADTLRPQLDAQILINPASRYSISAEADGTNTNGDLGAALSLTFSNKNTFHGGEVLSFKVRGAYEAIKGLEGYNDQQNYTEYSAEATLRFPTFKFPFLPRKINRELKAISELGLMYNTQDRPEFHRRILTARWGYNWSHHSDQRWQHTLDVLNINYVFLPWISETFRTEYLEGTNARSSILRNTYENLLIMRIGYGFVFYSRRNATGMSMPTGNGWQIRFNAETAGNFLYLASHLGAFEKDASGQYQALGIPFSQYAKFDFDYSKLFSIDDNNSLALHARFGIAIPYGNSLVVPYEKRYFAGGANNVRGWSVRELGPGGYYTSDGKVNFVNQTGNLQMLLSVEYRTKLFWKFGGAAFIDAGNIWNTRNYADIPNSQFKFENAIKQIAVAYGVGLRFNMDYFILRLDAGMKAINPAVPEGKDHYPIAHPKLSRDFALHFAVGLPF